FWSDGGGRNLMQNGAKARRRCTPAPSMFGFDLTTRLTGAKRHLYILMLRLGPWEMPAWAESPGALVEVGFPRETNPLQEILKDSLAAAKAHTPSARFDCGQLHHS